MSTLNERHPQLMVPHVYTFGVVVYTNGSAPMLSSDLIREAIITQVPTGTGVGSVTMTSHGVYCGQQGARYERS